MTFPQLLRRKLRASLEEIVEAQQNESLSSEAGEAAMNVDESLDDEVSIHILDALMPHLIRKLSQGGKEKGKGRRKKATSKGQSRLASLVVAAAESYVGCFPLLGKKVDVTAGLESLFEDTLRREAILEALAAEDSLDDEAQSTARQTLLDGLSGGVRQVASALLIRIQSVVDCKMVACALRELTEVEDGNDWADGLTDTVVKLLRECATRAPETYDRSNIVP